MNQQGDVIEQKLLTHHTTLIGGAVRITIRGSLWEYYIFVNWHLFAQGKCGTNARTLSDCDCNGDYASLGN